MTRLQEKRTRRNLESKRKKWLRNRGMFPTSRSVPTWQRRRARKQAAYIASTIPLRGVHADLHSPSPVKKHGFLSRLFRRGNA